MTQRLKTTWTELFGQRLEDTVVVQLADPSEPGVDRDALTADIRDDFVDEVNEVLSLYGAQMTATGEIYGSDDALIFVISEGVWDDLKARIRMIDVDAMIRAKL